MYNPYQISNSDDDNGEGSGSYTPNWSFTGYDPDWSLTGYEPTGSYTGGSYDDSSTSGSQEGDSADSSLDLACGFNFQNKFWLLGGWNNSRQV